MTNISGAYLQLSARPSKRVIRSESPEEEEEPVKRKTAAGKQKEIDVSMVCRQGRMDITYLLES